MGWNVAEAAVGLAAGLVAGSTALVGFGGDSVVESLFGAGLIWRLCIERRSLDVGRAGMVERRARRLVAVSMWVLALYVTAQSAVGLVAGDRVEASRLRIGLAVASLATMWLVARAR